MFKCVLTFLWQNEAFKRLRFYVQSVIELILQSLREFEE